MKNYKTAIILTILLTGSLLLFSACSAAESEPLSFPPELFTVKAENNEEVDCYIYLENATVDFQNIGGVETPLLKLQGSLPANCNNLSMRLDPPTTYKYIAVYLIAYAETDSSANAENKPFNIAMPITNLAPGAYNVVVNEQLKIAFEMSDTRTSQ